VNVPGDEPGAHDSQRMRAARLTAQPVRGKSGRRGSSRGRDDRTLEYGKGIADLVVIEHEDGRSTWKAPLDVRGITGDPLQAGYGEAVSKVGGKRDDPTVGLLREPQEVAVGVDGFPAGVREIRIPNDLDTISPMRVDDVKNGLAVDDRQLEAHGLLEPPRPCGIEHGVEVWRTAVGAHEHYRGALGQRHPRRISLDCRERCPAGAAHEQSVGREEFPAPFNAFALGYRDIVVNPALQQHGGDDARPNAGNMTFAGFPTEDDGPLGIASDDPNFRVALFQPTRHPGDRPRRA